LISAEVIWDLRSCDLLQDEWSALDAIGLSEPCTSLAWTRALLETHVEDSDAVFVVVLRSAGRAVAIVPAVLRRERVLGLFEVAAIYPLCELTPAHSDFLRDSDRPEIVRAFFEAIATLPCRWDILRIRRLLESNPITLQFADYLAVSGFKFRMRREQPAFLLALDGSYEDFLAARSAKFRNYLRRKTRQLQSLGQLSVVLAGSDKSVGDAYDDLVSIEERSWKHSQGTSIAAVTQQRDFYQQLCEGAFRSGRLHLMVMYLDDVPIAYNLGIVTADRYSYLKTSFDEHLRKVSPATVLRARLIENLVAEGIQTMDFPGQPDPWVEQWTEQWRWRTSVLVFNRTPRARLYRLLVGLRSGLSPFVRFASSRSRGAVMRQA
jgi:CelD/BcsL family acetyltransferase involved in cellulose biosynthesis